LFSHLERKRIPKIREKNGNATWSWGMEGELTEELGKARFIGRMELGNLARKEETESYSQIESLSIKKKIRTGGEAGQRTQLAQRRTEQKSSVSREREGEGVGRKKKGDTNTCFSGEIENETATFGRNEKCGRMMGRIYEYQKR